MMIKKILASLTLVSVMAVSAAMFAAYEAHVINVTAKIENALTVDTCPIEFGTVFPQESINYPIDIKLSESFQGDENINSDTIDYMIRQKPKCALTNEDGTVADLTTTATGHVVIGADGKATIDCGDEPENSNSGFFVNWGPLPSLCPYLSKHRAVGEEDETGVEVNAFHESYVVVGTGTVEDPYEIEWTEATGTLIKPNDIEDGWIIDLRVPCFDGMCAQDWADYVFANNPNVDASDWMADEADEHKIFGCDLWIEVTGISTEE